MKGPNYFFVIVRHRAEVTDDHIAISNCKKNTHTEIVGCKEERRTQVNLVYNVDTLRSTPKTIMRCQDGISIDLTFVCDAEVKVGAIVTLSGTTGEV